LDAAIGLLPKLNKFLRQGIDEASAPEETLATLKTPGK